MVKAFGSYREVVITPWYTVFELAALTFVFFVVLEYQDFVDEFLLSTTRNEISLLYNKYNYIG
jgi:hypothetical protein